MRGVLVPILFVAACGDAPHWAPTRALCGLEYQTFDSHSWASPPVYPSEGCVDAVLADFNVDVRELLAADGLDDPYGPVYGEDVSGTSTGALLWAIHSLLTVDLGSLDQAHGRWMTDPLHDAFTEVAIASGERDVSALAYDYVAGEVGRTTVGIRPGAAAGMHRRELILYDLPGGIDGAAVLVHEARHHRGPDHLWCDGEPGCDLNATGSYGFQLAIHELARDATADELMVEVEQSWIDALEVRILDR